jgi:hypothetical protein
MRIFKGKWGGFPPHLDLCLKGGLGLHPFLNGPDNLESIFLHMEPVFIPDIGLDYCHIIIPDMDKAKGTIALKVSNLPAASIAVMVDSHGLILVHQHLSTS